MTPAEAFDRAGAVVIATVVRTPPTVNPPAMPLHLLEAERVFKGEVGARFEIAHNPRMGPDIELTEGHRYLLLLRRGEDGHWRTSYCNGSHKLSGGLPPAWEEALGEGAPPTQVNEPVSAPPVEAAPIQATANANPDPTPTAASGLWWGGGILAVGAGLWLWRRRSK